ncbi:condensin subunit ScpA [Oceanospirillum multiglobuliferum]|uniref:Segregation and condensation protein A n=1 Tax=Oceanospirillum multiglobuliferum TaxID=64969 RepID=A0A1T4L7S4_9GAMM|nr:ScpA family protein [Oceanospirillum multiglobuliferum]OPX56762.1 segregation/condensation protein A [Oceanospirillum multiglobuliferum]SJZ50776.1 condensin subunit ScpA [Oceanospirillum multiglobuliferum]
MSALVPSEQLEFWARVGDETVTEVPVDLYIPPEALRVFLETFEGPLDLLLYLIRKQNLDILAINVAHITRQYMEYMELMQELEIGLAGEYLVMAALLTEIKSRSLLPRSHNTEDEDDEDPRAQLIRRLQEYEQLKEAAEKLDQLPRQERDIFPAQVLVPEYESYRPPPEVDLNEVMVAMALILKRVDRQAHHHIEMEPLSTRERMAQILELLSEQQYMLFERLFKVEEGRLGVVVTFLALMELVKSHLVDLVQTEPFSPIYVRARTLQPDQGDGSDDDWQDEVAAEFESESPYELDGEYVNKEVADEG